MEGSRRDSQIIKIFSGKAGLIFSFFSALLLALIVFALAGILPGGKSVSWNTDTMDQMAAFYAMLARHIKNGGSIFYSWETSMGQNTTLLYALCSYSPVLILYMIIPDVYTATIISMLIKIALSSACFYVFIEYGLGWRSKWNCFFPLCYAFSGFMLEYMMATNLTDALYILPLIMFAVIRSIRTKRFLLLSLVYTFSFINEMYMAFLTGIFSAIALLAYLYIKDGNAFIRNNLRYLVRYTAAVIAAVLLSMCMLFPAIMSYFSYNGFNTLLDVEHIGLFDLGYSLFFGRPTSLRTNIPFLYCGLPVVLLIPVYFMNDKINKSERIMSLLAVILMVVSLYFDPLYLFLHVFNRPDGFTVRYAFLFVFVMVLLAARALRFRKEEPDKAKGTGVIAYILIMMLTALSLILLHDNIGEFADGKGVKFALFGNSVLIPLWGGAWYFSGRKKENNIPVIASYILLVIELGAQALFNVNEFGLLSADQIREKTAQMDSFVKALNDVTGDTPKPEYRAYAAAYPGYNQNATYGFMGMGQFSSSNYAGVNALMKRLGNPISGVYYSQEGATDLTDMLLAVRYRGKLTDSREEGGPGFEVYDKALPVAYMCSDDLLKDIRYDGDPFAYQNAMVSAMCGEVINVYEKAEVYGYQENMLIYQQTDKGYSVRNADDAQYGDLLLGIPEAGYERAYAYFKVFPYSGRDEEKLIPDEMATDIALFSPDDRKGNGARFNIVIEDGIIEMTKDGNAFVVSLADYEKSDKSFDYNEQLFYYQNEEMLSKAYDTLNTGGWEIKEWRDTLIRAKVNVTDNKQILFMSIPYDRGWKVFVDGIEVPVEAVLGDSMMAVRLTEGEHEMMLIYETPGKKDGIIMMIIGIIMLFFMTLFDEIKKNMNHEK